MDSWADLRRLTSARIALGRSGGSVLTRERLSFQLAHARARDAVLSPFDAEELAARLAPVVGAAMVVNSAAATRAEYLRRPDLGRRLSEESRVRLGVLAEAGSSCDLAVILSDGLSTSAVMTQGELLLAALVPLVANSGWRLGPVVIARNGRVALQDEIGEMLGARIALMLIGERPGLGSADSLGAYFTYAPGAGRTDADRNCVSNIRAGGLPPMEAARKLHYLLAQSYAMRLSGVRLKDTSDLLPGAAPQDALG